MPEVHVSDDRIQYSLMLKLPAQTVQRVKAIQDEFSEKFGFANALITYPHVTLAYWEMDPRYEHRLYPRLERQGAETGARQIRLNGFEQLSGGAFCIRMEDAEAVFRSFFEKKGFFRKKLGMETRAAGISFTDHLHISVARRLTADQLKMVFEEWRARRFYHEFSAEGMVLIKAAEERKRAVGEFAFSGSSSGPGGSTMGIQGSLF